MTVAHLIALLQACHPESCVIVEAEDVRSRQTLPVADAFPSGTDVVLTLRYPEAPIIG